MYFLGVNLRRHWIVYESFATPSSLWVRVVNTRSPDAARSLGRGACDAGSEGTARTHASDSSSRRPGIKQRAPRTRARNAPACSPLALACSRSPRCSLPGVPTHSLVLHFVTLLDSTLVVFEFAYALRVPCVVACTLCPLLNTFNYRARKQSFWNKVNGRDQQCECEYLCSCVVAPARGPSLRTAGGIKFSLISHLLKYILFRISNSRKSQVPIDQ